MGAWGAGLYSDDTTCEVRDEFRAHLSSGLSPSAAEDLLLERFGGLLEERQIACLVYLALADTQWKLGCLSTKVQAHAMAFLLSDGDLMYWEQDSPSDVVARKRTLHALRYRLSSPQPPWRPPKKSKERPVRRQLDLPIGSVLRLNIPESQFAFLKLVGFWLIGNVDTAIFRLLPWRSRQMPTLNDLEAISERWVLIDEHHEFSILVDGRKKLISLLHPLGIVLPNATPIDKGRWRAMGIEILPVQVAGALQGLGSAR